MLLQFLQPIPLTSRQPFQTHFAHKAFPAITAEYAMSAARLIDTVEGED
jgi:hypothetical protein